jgi:hypothetical protein
MSAMDARHSPEMLVSSNLEVDAGVNLERHVDL